MPMTPTSHNADHIVVADVDILATLHRIFIVWSKSSPPNYMLLFPGERKCSRR